MENQTDTEILFEEKQYLGYNKFSNIRRLVLAMFCFLLYFFTMEDQVDFEAGEQTTVYIFYLGIIVLLISVISLFILHIHTKVINGSIMLDGLWTARKVKIDLNSIAEVKKIPYSRYLLNRPVYNLHVKGKIRFYTRGNEAIQLTDKDGLIYIIGSQRAAELEKVLLSQISAS